MKLLLDVAVSVGQCLVGLALLYAGTIKLRDLHGARIAVLDYRVVPPRLTRPVAVALGATEVVVGVGVTMGFAIAMPIALLLLAALSAAAASALARGLRIQCHCFGEGEPLSRATLARNAVIAAVLVVGLFLELPARSPFSPQLVLAPLPQILSVGLAVAIGAGLLALNRLVRLSRRSVAALKG